MTADHIFRMYSTVRLSDNPRRSEILAHYGQIDPATYVTQKTSAELQKLLSVLTDKQDFGFIESLEFNLPSSNWTQSVDLPTDISKQYFDGQIEYLNVGLEDLNDLVLAFASTKSEQLDAFTAALEDGPLGAFIDIGADLPVQGTYHWCPTGASNQLFGTRQQAEQLLGVDLLHTEGLQGEDVIAVVIDQGLNEELIPKNFAFRWPLGGSPVSGPGMGHGDIVARNIIRCAPKAGIIDMPMIPPKIGDLPSFLSDAQAALNSILALISFIEQIATNITWIFVNAWAVYDRRLESGMAVKYSDDGNHPFNKKMDEIATSFSDARVDVVLAAGNCGEFCSDARCGPNDTGPGNSIFGANAHPKVLTVGAVRTDDIWIGSSSQGPGLIATEKPDVCAPSHFRENNESANGNLGTSAAAAMAAGVVALLRCSNVPKGKNNRTPEELIAILRNTARKTGFPAGWDDRRGRGTIDGKAAFDAL